MNEAPLISVVLGTYNRLRFLKYTIETIRRELQSIQYETIVIDGGSTDGTLRWLTSQKDILTILQHNHGSWRGKDLRRRSWGYFMNLGFKTARGGCICMLSDDCLVVPGAILNGYKLLQQKLDEGRTVGAVAFYWRNWPDQKRYWVGLTFGDRLFVNHGLYLSRALSEVGYVDEDSYSFYHADGDLCLRMWEKGYECIESPDSFIEHHIHTNPGTRRANALGQKPDWEIYQKRWAKLGLPRIDWIEKDFFDTNRTAEHYFGKLLTKTTSRVWRTLSARLS